MGCNCVKFSPSENVMDLLLYFKTAFVKCFLLHLKKKKSFLVRFNHYYFCVPSFKAQKCPCSRDRSPNHSAAQKLRAP